MPRASYQRKICKDCGGERQDVGHVTWRGYCIACGTARHKAEVHQLANHSGPYFQDWRRKHAAAVGAVLLEDLDQKA